MMHRDAGSCREMQGAAGSCSSSTVLPYLHPVQHGYRGWGFCRATHTFGAKLPNAAHNAPGRFRCWVSRSRIESCGATYPPPASHVIPVQFRRGGWNEKDARWAGRSVSGHGEKKKPVTAAPSSPVREQQLRDDIDRFTHHHRHHRPLLHTHT